MYCREAIAAKNKRIYKMDGKWKMYIHIRLLLFLLHNCVIIAAKVNAKSCEGVK